MHVLMQCAISCRSHTVESVEQAGQLGIGAQGCSRQPLTDSPAVVVLTMVLLLLWWWWCCVQAQQALMEVQWPAGLEQEPDGLQHTDSTASRNGSSKSCTQKSLGL